MIITRAPMRISFVGGGSDLPDYYKRFQGKVISATIDKYVYVVVNPAPLLKGVHARYSLIEHVKDPSELKNSRLREVMLYFGVKSNVEVGTFSHLKAGLGLGGSSSFTVALIKAFASLKGKRLDNEQIAKIACEIEVDRLKEPIGKQDQYAVALGGFNIFNFETSGDVKRIPLKIRNDIKLDLEKHLLMFFTGNTRSASRILKTQKKNTVKKFKQIQKMVNLVNPFSYNLKIGKYKKLGKLLHENWNYKKSLANTISNPEIDILYNTALKNGAYGGKISGAGGGGCMYFLINPERRDSLKKLIIAQSHRLAIKNFEELPIKTVKKGVELITRMD